MGEHKRRVLHVGKYKRRVLHMGEYKRRVLHVGEYKRRVLHVGEHKRRALEDLKVNWSARGGETAGEVEGGGGEERGELLWVA